MIEIIVEKKYNKVIILSHIDIENFMIEIYDFNNENIIYKANIDLLVKHNSYWFVPNYIFKNDNCITIKILQDEKILKVEKIKFENFFNNKDNFKYAVIMSMPAVGDGLFTIPAIKKLYEKVRKKIIVFTYIPEIFINNPYVEVIKIDRNHFISPWFDIPDKYKCDNNMYIQYINSIYLLDDWRYFDHRLILANYLNLKLQPEDLRMDFFPDDYIEIQNLPERFICINPSATHPERTWSLENWQKFIDLIQNHIPVVAIGKNFYDGILKTHLDIKISNGLNLINNDSQNTLSQAFHIINKSETFVTMNNGLFVLALCGNSHITQLSTPWNTNHYFNRNNIKNYNYNLVEGKCDKKCLTNSSYSVNRNKIGSEKCFLCDDLLYECHPTPEQVYESVLKKINNI